jgi:uncharacterized protein (UPF0332 family)
MSHKTLTDEQRRDIVKYRMENARATIAEVESHRQNGFYNTAVNRMYYACYYAATAMLVAMGIETKSHDGVRQCLGKHIVLRGLLNAELGRFYSRLFSKRSTGDYDDFINHTLATVDELLPKAHLFIDTILEQLDKWLNANNAADF